MMRTHLRDEFALLARIEALAEEEPARQTPAGTRRASSAAPAACRPSNGSPARVVIKVEALEQLLALLVRLLEGVVEPAVRALVELVLDVVDGVERPVFELVRRLLDAPDPAAEPVE